MTVQTDLMAAADVARYFGVTQGAIGNLRAKGRFIEPFANVGGRDLFLRPDVEAWGRRTQRKPFEPGRIYDSEGYDVTDAYIKKESA